MKNKTLPRKVTQIPKTTIQHRIFFIKKTKIFQENGIIANWTCHFETKYLLFIPCCQHFNQTIGCKKAEETMKGREKRAETNLVLFQN